MLEHKGSCSRVFQCVISKFLFTSLVLQQRAWCWIFLQVDFFQWVEWLDLDNGVEEYSNLFVLIISLLKHTICCWIVFQSMGFHEVNAQRQC